MPGESPAALDDYGTTAREQAEGEPLGDRLAGEDPEDGPSSGKGASADLSQESDRVGGKPGDENPQARREAGYPAEEAAVRVEPD